MNFKNLCLVANVIAGQSPPSTTYNTIGKGLPFFQGKADFQEKFPKVRNWCTSEKKKEAFPGDILMSVRAPVGPVNICNQRSVIGRGVSAIRTLEGTHGEYLYYFLKSNEENIAKLGTGSTFKAITQETISKIKIPFPPFIDQIRIAILLSRVEALIATRKDNLRLLNEFLRSTFLEMFVKEKIFPNRKIKSIADKSKRYALSSGPFGSSLTSEHYVDSGVLVLRGTNISKGFLCLDDVKFVSEEKANDLSRSEIAPNDIVIVAVGSSGQAFKIPQSLQGAIISQNFNKISPDTKLINPTYLEYCINSNFVQSQFRKNITDTVRTFLSLTKIKEVFIPYPPIELQSKFASIVEKVETLKTLYRHNLNELENLYNALSQKAFKGELDLSRIPLPTIIANGQFSPPLPSIQGVAVVGKAMSHPVAREKLLRRLFVRFIAENKGTSFSLEEFWPFVEQKVLDHTDENSPPLGVAEYDQAKQWLFDLLKNGGVAQHFNEETNRLELNVPA